MTKEQSEAAKKLNEAQLTDALDKVVQAF